MIKAITLIKRKYELTVAQFQEYWLCRHTVAVRRLPGVRRYVQNHPLPESYDQGKAEYDGIAELWGDDTRAFKTMAASQAYRMVQEDEEQFIDRRSLALIFTSEFVLKPGAPPAGGVKLLELLRRKPGVSIEDFQHYWLTRHAALVTKLPFLQAYVQSPARPGGYNAGVAPLYDGLSTLWFATLAELRQALASPAYVSATADASNFQCLEEKTTLICAEYVIAG